MKESIFQPTIETAKSKIENFRNVFSPYESAGVATDTWINLQKALEENSLSDDHESALRNLGDLEIFVQDVEKKEEYEHFIEFINKHFQDDIIQLALVSAIHFRTGEVHLSVTENNILNLDKGSYSIPVEIFKQQWQSMNPQMQEQVRKSIYRGESFSNWYIDGHTNNKYFPCPIIIYNQQFDEKNHAIENGEDLELHGLEYLAGIPREERKESFMHGTMAHEIAHNVYVNLIYNTELENAWKNIIDETGNLTKYADLWEERNLAKDYNENFAEAIRLYTTDANYLQQKGLDSVVKFISDNFPEIIPSLES